MAPAPVCGPQPVAASPWAYWKVQQFNPFAVHRMIATFVAAIAFANYLTFPILFAWIAQLPALDPNTLVTDLMTPEIILLATAIQDALLVYFTYLVMFRHRYLTLASIRLTGNRNLTGLLLLGVLAGLALFGLATVIEWPISQSGLFPEGTSMFDMRGRPLGLLCIGLATVVIAPLTEELFFRGYAFTAIERKWGPLAGTALSALMFSAAHLSIPSLLPIFVMGVLLALVYRKYGIVPCIIAHAMNNLIVVVLMFLGYS